MMYSTLVPLIISDTICSDSLEAVPFPIAITLMLYLSISPRTVLIDSVTLFCGSVGKIKAVSKTLPVSSMIASLQPVLKAGSQPKMVFPTRGLSISN